MRPYLAVVKDSFREALRSPVLWVLFGMLSLCLIGLLPLGAREDLNVDIHFQDVTNWAELAKRMHADYLRPEASPGKRIWERLDPRLREDLQELETPKPGDAGSAIAYRETAEDLSKELGKIIRSPDFYDEATWEGITLKREAREILKFYPDNVADSARQRLHRLAIEAAYPELIRARPEHAFIFSYGFGLWESPPIPITKQRFHEQLGSGVAFLSDWIVGLVVVFVAILVTAPIIPRMFDQGQLHLLLSKPVSRSFLFLAQFFGGCAYMLLLTTYLIGGLWLILGWRLGYWEPRLLWMVPVYVFMFSVYYTVSAASAVVWRSTMMAIINGFLFFLVCFSIGTSQWWLQQTVVERQKVVQIIPAGDQLLVTNEGGVVNAWNADERKWETRFLPKALEGVGDYFVSLVGIDLRTVGPIYVPERNSLVAVQYSLEQSPGPINVSPQAVVVGRGDNQWMHTVGPGAPLGTFGLFREPEGTLLIASSLGLNRLSRDPAEKPAPPKIFGIQLPTPPPSPFQSAVPEGTTLLLPPPATAAYDVTQAQLAIVSQGELIHLKRGSDKLYRVAGRTSLRVSGGESVLVAISGDTILIGYRDGRVEVRSTSNLEEERESRPEKRSAPRFLHASPRAGQFAVVCHNGALWTYDAKKDVWDEPRVKGRGDVSGAAFDDQGRLWVAEHTNRISVYDPDSLALVERYSPRLDTILRSYYYFVLPVYTVLPKPGEFGKTMQYLLTGSDTTEAEQSNDNDATTMRTKLNPWKPVYSGLAFMAVVLGATCVYFERQEY